MNIVTTVTPVTTDRLDPHAQLEAAENAAWDDYEAALAVVQEAQDSFVAAGSATLKAYNAVQWRRDAACNALDAALAVARAEYEDSRVVTGDDGLDHYL